MLRDWRRRRRLSQLGLACDANISAKHLGCIETGRSDPSSDELLHLAACLDMPLRARNALLMAAGHPPAYPRSDFHSPVLASARRNVEVILAALDPFPAVLIDRHWTVLSANKAVADLVAGAETMLLRPPFNLLRLCLHPAGLGSRIVNLAEWRGQIIARLRHEIERNGDVGLVDLLEEIQDYPGPRGDPFRPPTVEAQSVATPLQLVTIDGALSFFNTTTRFAAASDVTVSEMAIEAFLPADAATAAILKRAPQRSATGDIFSGQPEDRRQSSMRDQCLEKQPRPERRAAPD